MPDHLDDWFQELRQRRSDTITSKIVVTSDWYRPLGPRQERAKIKVSVEPSDRFEVVNATQSKAPHHTSYLQWAIFGLLDVLLVVRLLL